METLNGDMETLMSAPPPTGRTSDPASSATPIPGTDTALFARTVTWLARHPDALAVVRSVCTKLAELERAGQHPGTLDALRFVLIHHHRLRSSCRSRSPGTSCWSRPPWCSSAQPGMHQRFLGVPASPIGRIRKRRSSAGGGSTVGVAGTQRGRPICRVRIP
jgi:hypothetical protein